MKVMKIKKVLIALGFILSFFIADASRYSASIVSMYKVEGKPNCLLMEVVIWDNMNTPQDRSDDRIVGHGYIMACFDSRTNSSNDTISNCGTLKKVTFENTTYKETLKLVKVSVYPSPISTNEKLNVDLGNNEFDNISIMPANDIDFSGKNVIILDKDVYKGHLSIDISKLNHGVYILNAVSEKNKIVATTKFVVK
jgi:hypothetical protein